MHADLLCYLLPGTQSSFKTSVVRGRAVCVCLVGAVGNPVGRAYDIERRRVQRPGVQIAEKIGISPYRHRPEVQCRVQQRTDHVGRSPCQQSDPHRALLQHPVGLRGDAADPPRVRPEVCMYVCVYVCVYVCTVGLRGDAADPPRVRPQVYYMLLSITMSYCVILVVLYTAYTIHCTYNIQHTTYTNPPPLCLSHTTHTYTHTPQGLRHPGQAHPGPHLLPLGPQLPQNLGRSTTVQARLQDYRVFELIDTIIQYINT
jgi:hypothetical protein